MQPRQNFGLFVLWIVPRRSKQTLNVNFYLGKLQVLCLLKINSQIIHHKTPDISFFINLFIGGLSGAVAGFGFYAYQRGIGSVIIGLQSSSKFKTMRRHYPVIMIGSGN